MIAAQMQRLASRLGLRDGEVYTIVTGAVLALLLAAVGLPGVFRGLDPSAVAEAALASPPTSSSAAATTTVAEGPPPLAARLPAIAPAPRSASSAGRSSAAPPTPASPPTDQPASSDRVRPIGDLAVLAQVPEPGSPDGVAVGPDGTIWAVSDDAGAGASALWAFSPSGAHVGSWRTPAQPAGRSRGLTGVAVDRAGTVWVTDASSGRVLKLDAEAGALVPVVAAVDIPACGLLRLREPCESGLVDSAPLLVAIAAAPDGTLVVADRGQGVLWRLDGGELSVLAALEDRIAGDGPAGVSFASDDELVFAVGARLSSFPPGLPAVFQLRLLDDEPAGAPVLVAELGVGETPGDVAVGTTGRVYVSIPSTGTVADIGIDQGDRIDLGADGEPAMAGPRGLALRARSLLVADVSDRLLDLAVEDHPVQRGPT